MNFINNINIFELFINSIIAIIAFIAIKISIKQFNKNILITKVEEIFSLCELLGYQYSNLYQLYSLLFNYHESNIDKNLANNLLNSYKNEREFYLKNFDIKELIKAHNRLEVLSKTYLNGILQINTLSYIRLFKHLIECAVSMNWAVKEIYWKEGFPDEISFNKYLDKLEDNFVKIISVKKQNIFNKLSREKIKKYSENQFKIDLGLKQKNN